MDPITLSTTGWQSGYDTPRPHYVPRTSLTDARDKLLIHPNTKARAIAGELSTEESIYYAQCLLEPLPQLNSCPGAGRRQPVRNSHQWAGPLERHVQAVALKQVRKIRALVHKYWTDLNLDRKRLAQNIMMARRSQLLIRQDRNTAAGLLGPAYSFKRDFDLIWGELLRQGVW